MSRLVGAMCLLVLVSAPASAHEPVPWGGAGWYVFISPPDPEPNGRYQTTPIDGPFTNEDACRVRLLEWRQADKERRYVSWCAHETEAW